MKVTFWGQPTVLGLDRDSGKTWEVRFPATDRVTGEEGEMVVRFSDHRQTDGLIYPFAATGRLGGREVFAYRLRELLVNPPLPGELFAPPADLGPPPDE